MATPLDFPRMYKDAIPFDNYNLLKDWDASMYSEAIPAILSFEESRATMKRHLKFEHYVSTNNEH